MARTRRPAATNPSPQSPATRPAPHGSPAQGNSPARRSSPDQTSSRRGPVVGAAAVAALALAGCGSVTATQSAAQSASSSSATPPAPVAPSHLLCARPGAVSQVVITRTGLLPRVPAQQNQPGGSTPVAPPRKDMPKLPPQPAQTPGPGVPVVPGTSATPAPPRPPVLPTGPIEPPPPAASTLVTSAAKARALAWAVCDLPAFPRGPVNCPLLLAGSYRLSFTADGRKLPLVTAQSTGCQTVTGLGTVRTAVTRPGFWKLLSGLAGPIPLSVHLPGGPVSPGGPFRPRVG